MTRTTKAELEWRLLAVKKEMAQRRLIGTQMANICWNLAQGREFTPYDRDIADGLRGEWDAIKRAELEAL